MRRYVQLSHPGALARTVVSVFNLPISAKRAPRFGRPLVICTTIFFAGGFPRSLRSLREPPRSETRVKKADGSGFALAVGEQSRSRQSLGRCLTENRTTVESPF